MFENILDQQHVISRLEEDLQQNRLPASMLFFGPNFSGKISTALELARALSCEKSGEWSCACGSCKKHRSLTHPDLVMLGPRYFIRELDGSAEVLRRTQKPFARYLVIRSARKLTRRFDPWLWEGEETKARALRSSLDTIEEILDELDPQGDDLPQKRIERLISSLSSEAAKVVKGVNLNHIPIFMVRNLSSWAHTTGRGRGKTIILENADAMLDSARNALLKILEEPPEGVHFILTTPKRGALLPTIVSRLRPYGFRERSEEGDREVLTRIFREPSGEFRSLREYFLGFDMSASELRHHAETLVHLAAGLRSDGDLAEVFSIVVQKRERFIALLEEAESVLRQLLVPAGPGLVTLETIEELHRRLMHARRMFEGYNQSPELLLEGFLYGGAE